MGGRLPVPEDTVKSMIDAYGSGVNQMELSRRFGVSQPGISAIFRRRGVSMRSRSQSKRVYPINEYFFDNIDSEAKAYWLGFLAADGSVSDCNHSIKIGLSSKDRSHLDKFRNDIGTTRPIFDGFTTLSNGKTYAHSEFCIGSIHVHKSLSRLGIVSNKSFVCKAWGGPPELMRHYWRGVVDGDGCLTKSLEGKWSLSLVGSKYMVESFAEFVRGLVTTKASVVPTKRIWQFSVSGHIASVVADALYSGANVYLDRKMEKAKQLLAWHHQSMTEEQIRCRP